MNANEKELRNYQEKYLKGKITKRRKEEKNTRRCKTKTKKYEEDEKKVATFNRRKKSYKHYIFDQH